jgi:hypothetical protein
MEIMAKALALPAPLCGDRINHEGHEETTGVRTNGKKYLTTETYYFVPHCGTS